MNYILLPPTFISLETLPYTKGIRPKTINRGTLTFKEPTNKYRKLLEDRTSNPYYTFINNTIGENNSKDHSNNVQSIVDILDSSFAYFSTPQIESPSSECVDIPNPSNKPEFPSPGESTLLDIDILSPESRRLDMQFSKDNYFNTFESIEEVLEHEEAVEAVETVETVEADSYKENHLRSPLVSLATIRSCFKFGRRLDPSVAKVHFKIQLPKALFRRLLTASWDIERSGRGKFSGFKTKTSPTAAY